MLCTTTVSYEKFIVRHIDLMSVIIATLKYYPYGLFNTWHNFPLEKAVDALICLYVYEKMDKINLLDFFCR